MDPFALLSLNSRGGDSEVRFDAGRNALPGARMYRWVNAVRQPSYDAVQRRNPQGCQAPAGSVPSGRSMCTSKGDMMSDSIPDKPSQAEGDVGDDDITAAEQESDEMEPDAEAG